VFANYPVWPRRHRHHAGGGLRSAPGTDKFGVVEFQVQRRVLIALAIVGSALILSGCAGPCGWIWDDWYHPAKTCHRQAIGQ
jgi:hypothetical protein